MIRKLSLIVAIALLLAVPASASAFWPYGGFIGGPWGNGYNFGYSSGYVPAPPYFSVFPPVYYSPQITARPYGASPYAWPAGFSPLTVAPRYEAAPPPEPVMIVNPYVAGAAVPTGTNLVAQSQQVANPFVSAR